MSQLLKLSGPSWRPIYRCQLLQDDFTQPDRITLAALRVLDDLPCNYLRERVSPPLKAQSGQDVFASLRPSTWTTELNRAVLIHLLWQPCLYLGNSLAPRNPRCPHP
jgi:hypothetical protein